MKTPASTRNLLAFLDIPPSLSYPDRKRMEVSMSARSKRNPVKPVPLATRMERRIDDLDGNVVLRQDFKGMADDDQIGRGMRTLVRKGKIVRIGQGLYAKATVGPLSGKILPRKDITDLAREAMSRLGYEVVPTRWERDYAQRKTEQVPLGRVVGVTKRVRRTISWEGRSVEFERRRG
jgi:hypothetical protein